MKPESYDVIKEESQNSCTHNSLKSVGFVNLPELWQNYKNWSESVNSNGSGKFRAIPEQWNQVNANTVNSHTSAVTYLNSQASIGSLLPEWLERSLSIRGQEKQYNALPDEWGSDRQSPDKVQTVNHHCVMQTALASLHLLSGSACEVDNIQRGLKRSIDHQSIHHFRLDNNNNNFVQDRNFMEQTENMFQAQTLSSIGSQNSVVYEQKKQKQSKSESLHFNSQGLGQNMETAFRGASIAPNLTSQLHLPQTVALVKNNNNTVQSELCDMKTEAGDKDKDKDNTRWNSWSHEEEVFLVVAVLDRFFRRGSLASATKLSGKKSDAFDTDGGADCWQDIKCFYDRVCSAWQILPENTVKPSLIARSSSALCRHFKIMKVRAAEGDINGTNDGNFRIFLREWDEVLNIGGRLIEQTY